MAHPQLLTAGLLVATCALAGCTTLKLAEYPRSAAADCPATTHLAGVVLGVRPLADKAESRRYFGTDLADAGLITVLVVVENRGPESLLIGKEGAALVGRAAPVGRGHAPPDGAGAGVALVGAGILSFPLMFIGFKMMSDDTIIQQRFVMNELKTQTVSPGKSAQGFLYFARPKDKAQLPSQWTLRLMVRRGGGEPEPVEVPFNWEAK